MQVIVPICVTLGVLFPQQIGVLKPIIPTLFAFMTFQGALSNTFHQVAEVFRRPLHLILALFVSAVLIPIAAYAVGSLFFGSNPNLVCGIVLEYSVPVAVTAFMWISMFGGNGPLALTIILTSSVISPVTIPLTLKLLLGATVAIDVPGMMQNMAFIDSPTGYEKRSELLFRPFLLYSTLILSEDYTQTETGMVLPLNVASQCLRLVRSITVVAGYMESPFLSCRINFQTDFRRNVESP